MAECNPYSSVQTFPSLLRNIFLISSRVNGREPMRPRTLTWCPVSSTALSRSRGFESAIDKYVLASVNDVLAVDQASPLMDTEARLGQPDYNRCPALRAVQQIRPKAKNLPLSGHLGNARAQALEVRGAPQLLSSKCRGLERLSMSIPIRAGLLPMASWPHLLLRTATVFSTPARNGDQDRAPPNGAKCSTESIFLRALPAPLRPEGPSVEKSPSCSAPAGLRAEP